MLKKSDFPYFNKGRWYQIRIRSNGKKHDLLDSEIPCDITEDAVYIQEPGFHILDMKLDLSFRMKKTADAFSPALLHKGAQQGFAIPEAGSYNAIIAWVYGYTQGKGGD